MANIKPKFEVRTPVLIVGGGPVGISLSMELAYWNVASVLVNEGSLCLVRPDQHIAWRGNKLPDEPKMIIKKVLGYYVVSN